MSKLSIFLWGPKASGKTFLIKAFRHKLSKIEKGLKSRRSVDVVIDLYESESTLLDDREGVQISLTEEASYKIWEFKKMPRKMTFPAQASASFHKLSLLDSPGEAITQNDENAEMAFVAEVINEEEYFIVLIDPENDDVENYSKYLRLFRDQIRGRKRTLAICVSKIDALGIGMENAKNINAILKRGKIKAYADEIIEILDDLANDGHTIAFFPVSAAGRVQQGRRSVPNIVADEIQDVKHWEPINVEKPFFWLLENIENSRIDKLKQLDGLFYRNWLFGKIYKEARKNERYSYKEITNKLLEPIKPGDAVEVALPAETIEEEQANEESKIFSFEAD